VQGEAVDQRHRGDGQRGEDARQAQGQARSGGPAAVQPDQPEQVVENQRRQCAQPNGADQQQPEIHLPKLSGIGGGATHQRQNDHQRAQQQQSRGQAFAAGQAPDQSGHVNHSLANRQSSDR
jgi:hypothetical protein